MVTTALPLVNQPAVNPVQAPSFGPTTPTPVSAVSGTDPRVSALTRAATSPTTAGDTSNPYGYTGAQAIASNTVDQVRQSAQRISDIYAQGQARRQAAAQAAAQAEADRIARAQPTPVSAGTTASVDYQHPIRQTIGRAWQPNGQLSASRNALMQDASSYLGTPYVLGGTSHQAIDCSGLVMAVYNKMGFNINQHHAAWQGQYIPGVRTSFDNLRPGDLVAWKNGNHIAIYAGNGEIIESANPRTGTVRRPLTTWASPNDVFGIQVRLPGE